jgi:hypothetical protein
MSSGDFSTLFAQWATISKLLVDCKRDPDAVSKHLQLIIDGAVGKKKGVKTKKKKKERGEEFDTLVSSPREEHEVPPKDERIAFDGTKHGDRIVGTKRMFRAFCAYCKEPMQVFVAGTPYTRHIVPSWYPQLKKGEYIYATRNSKFNPRTKGRNTTTR